MDPLSDMLNRIKNAGARGKETVFVSHSKFTLAVANSLLREGYINGVSKRGRGPKKVLEILLSYDEGKNFKIKGLKRLSKPSRRLYVNVGTIQPVRQGYGQLFLSTPNGILTGKEARKARVGGETLFEIW